MNEARAIKNEERKFIVQSAQSAYERTGRGIPLSLSRASDKIPDKVIESEAEAIAHMEKIGAYAKREIYSALAENRVPNDDFERLLTVEGTKELLGASLTTCPLFSHSRMMRRGGLNGCWSDPAVRDGEKVFVNSQWYEGHRAKLDRLLARWKEDPAPHVSANGLGESVYESRLAELLCAEFANGLRPGSIIDSNRIRRLYRQHFGESLPDGFDFVTALPKVGFVHDGKVFPRRKSGDGGWKRLIESCIRQGHVLFQFSRFMELHADKFMHMGIASVGMLHDAIQREASDLYDVSADFFVPKADLPIEARIESAVVQDSVVVDVKEVSKRLPYVDEITIRRLCANADSMIWNGAGTYAVLDRISFDGSDVKKGVLSCDASVGEYGFFSLVHLNLDASAALNDRRLSGNALRHAFFLRFLSGKFDLHGQIVCARGAKLDAQAPLRSFCRGRSVVTLSGVRAVAKECRIADYLALQTLHEEMVRVDAEHFVTPSLVAFDISATDACIGSLVGGRATPFGDVCHFATFPAVPGYVWNSYLFESYLRRASKRFRILKQGVVSEEPVGVVVPVSGELVPLPHSDRYDGKLVATAFACAASAAGIPPEPDAVGDFLCASRCVARRTKSAIEATVAAMCAKERN